MQNASEERFRGLFRMDRATFRATQSVLRSRSCAPFFSRRGRRHLSLDVQLAIALYRLGHYGDACSVEAVADMFGVSVGAVVKCTRRVIGALGAVAPRFVKWANARRRAELSESAASKFGFDGCVGAADGTTFPLAYQPALQPWTYYDRKQRYSLSGLITCDWDGYITNVVLGCTGAAPDTFVQSLASWHRRPNLFFSAGQDLLGDKGMLYSRNLIGPFKEPEITGPEHRNFNYQLARLRVKSEHTIGILKGRWGSLKELRLALSTDKGDTFPLPPSADPSPERYRHLQRELVKQTRKTQ